MVIQIDDKAGSVLGCGYSCSHSDQSIMPACTLAVSVLLGVLRLFICDPLTVIFQSKNVNLNILFKQR